MLYSIHYLALSDPCRARECPLKIVKIIGFSLNGRLGHLTNLLYELNAILTSASQ